MTPDSDIKALAERLAALPHFLAPNIPFRTRELPAEASSALLRLEAERDEAAAEIRRMMSNAEHVDAKTSAAEARAIAAERVLRNLVRLKDYKDTVGADASYAAHKQLAWDEARSFLASLEASDDRAALAGGKTS